MTVTPLDDHISLCTLFIVSMGPELLSALVLTESREYYYCPERSCGKVMFLHLSVILSTRRVSTSGPRGSPWVDTLPPRADTPPRQTPPAQCMLGYGQQAGGTHPTGMHSCFLTIFLGVGEHPDSSHFTGDETVRSELMRWRS